MAPRGWSCAADGGGVNPVDIDVPTSLRSWRTTTSLEETYEGYKQ